MKHFLILFLLLSLQSNSHAQEIDTICSDCIENPQVKAQFNGGEEALEEWISANRDYPQASLEREDQARIYVSFIVEKDGTITNIWIEDKFFKELDDEAIRVIETMPKWIPAKHKRKKVRSKVVIEFYFTLA